MAQYTTTSQPLPFVEPYLIDYLARAQEVANVPYQASPTTATQANPYLTAGWQATANRALQGSPVMGAANQTLQNTLQGGYLSQNNPYLTDQINAAQGDLARNWNMVNAPQWQKAMQGSGSFGNTGVMQAEQYGRDNLANAMGNIGRDMRFNAYTNERNLMNSALGMAPQYAQQDYADANALLNVGQQAQTFNQAQADQQYKWWQEAQNYPQSRLNAYGQALGAIGGGTQTQTQPDPSTASQLVGGGLTGLALWQALFGNGG